MNPRTPLSRAEWLGAIAILVVLGALVFLGLPPFSGAIQCDGSVPTWMITEENEGTGCVELLRGLPPRDWDGSWICIGLCTEPNPSPYFPTLEPQRQEITRRWPSLPPDSASHTATQVNSSAASS